MSKITSFAPADASRSRARAWISCDQFAKPLLWLMSWSAREDSISSGQSASSFVVASSTPEEHEVGSQEGGAAVFAQEITRRHLPRRSRNSHGRRALTSCQNSQPSSSVGTAAANPRPAGRRREARSHRRSEANMIRRTVS